MMNLSQFGSCTLADDGCTTCGDVAVPVRVLAIGTDGAAICEDRVGERAEIMLEFTPDAVPGDVVMVHMGVAIAKVDARAATYDPTETVPASS